jgi:hypothetical protein
MSQIPTVSVNQAKLQSFFQVISDEYAHKGIVKLISISDESVQLAFYTDDTEKAQATISLVPFVMLNDFKMEIPDQDEELTLARVSTDLVIYVSPIASAIIAVIFR